LFKCLNTEQNVLLITKNKHLFGSRLLEHKMITIKYENSQILIKCQQDDEEKGVSNDSNMSDLESVDSLRRKIVPNRFNYSTWVNRIFQNKNQESFDSDLYMNSFNDRISTDSTQNIRIANLRIIHNIQLSLYKNLVRIKKSKSQI